VSTCVTIDARRYTRAELYASDHRPVRAVFSIDVRSVDAALKRKVATDVRKQFVGTGVLHSNSSSSSSSNINTLAGML
jgi:hypothetical protein